MSEDKSLRQLQLENSIERVEALREQRLREAEAAAREVVLRVAEFNEADRATHVAESAYWKVRRKAEKLGLEIDFSTATERGAKFGEVPAVFSREHDQWRSAQSRMDAALPLQELARRALRTAQDGLMDADRKLSELRTALAALQGVAA